MKNRKIALNLTKISFFAMLFYSVFFLAVLNVRINNMTMMLGAVTVVFMAVDMFYTGFDLKKLFTTEVWILLAFVVYSLVSSLLFATHKNSAVDGIIQLAESVVLMVVTVYIILRDRSIKFVSIVFIFVMAVMALYALINYESLTEINMDELDRLALTEATNPNVFGHNSVCALTLLPLFIKPGKRIRNLCLLALSAVFIVAIILSGSRMTFICLLVFAVLFFLRVYPMSISSVRKSSLGVRILVGTIALVGMLYVFVPLLQGTVLFQRYEMLFSVLNGGEGDGSLRMSLYEKGWEFFKSSPIVGIGYGNFLTNNKGVYSHSTYAELIACSGIIGTVIYASFYIKMLRSTWSCKEEGKDRDLDSMIMLIALAVIFALGVGEIIYYKINYFIIFGLIIGNRILFNERKTENEEAKGTSSSLQ